MEIHVNTMHEMAGVIQLLLYVLTVRIETYLASKSVVFPSRRQPCLRAESVAHLRSKYTQLFNTFCNINFIESIFVDLLIFYTLIIKLI